MPTPKRIRKQPESIEVVIDSFKNILAQTIPATGTMKRTDEAPTGPIRLIKITKAT